MQDILKCFFREIVLVYATHHRMYPKHPQVCSTRELVCTIPYWITGAMGPYISMIADVTVKSHSGFNTRVGTLTPGLKQVQDILKCFFREIEKEEAFVRLFSRICHRFAAEPRGNNSKRFDHFCLKCKARIWPGLCHLCQIRSTSVTPPPSFGVRLEGLEN